MSVYSGDMILLEKSAAPAESFGFQSARNRYIEREEQWSTQNDVFQDREDGGSSRKKADRPLHLVNGLCFLLNVHTLRGQEIKRMFVLGGPRAAFTPGPDGSTLLHVGAQWATVSELLLMLSYGAPIDAETDQHETALHIALKHRNFWNALILRAFGSSWWSPGWRPEAAQEAWRWENDSCFQMVDERLAKWIPSNMLLPGNGIRPEELRQFILDSGRVDYSKMLFWAAAQNKPNLVRFVLEFQELGVGWDVIQSRDGNGWTALHIAASKGHKEVISALMDGGADPELPISHDHWWSPLLKAAEERKKQDFSSLLSQGANIAAAWAEKGLTAFDLAEAGGHRDSLLVLRHKQLGRIRPPTHKCLKSIRKNNRESVSSSAACGSTARLNEPVTSDNTPAGNDKPPTQGITTDDGILRNSFNGTRVYEYTNPRPLTFSELHRSTALDRILATVQDPGQNFRFHMDDKIVKIAVLDTGLDLSHRDWRQARIVRFDGGGPVREAKEPRQWARIMDFKNFCGPPETDENNVTDVDGHGTQVTGIILRLAPRAEVYIAKVCEGDRWRGLPGQQDGPASDVPRGGLRPEAIVRAIDWAIEKNVDLINLSCGFSSPNQGIQDALMRAKANKIVVFAAMSNNANNEPPAWPAREPSLAIGIHSCKEGGTKASDFTPPPVQDSDNFITVGERIVTHWPEAKGGEFQLADGTSFATPVATAIAALILAFVRQKRCKINRREAENAYRLDDILKTEGMAKVLHKISNTMPGGAYHYIHPGLLWKDFDPVALNDQDTPETRQKWAWDVIRAALT